MTPKEISERAAAIRLPIKTLAERAGVHEDSAHRALKQQVDPRASTVERLSDAVKAEEAQLRDHLDKVAS